MDRHSDVVYCWCHLLSLNCLGIWKKSFDHTHTHVHTLIVLVLGMLAGPFLALLSSVPWYNFLFNWFQPMQTPQNWHQTVCLFSFMLGIQAQPTESPCIWLRFHYRIHRKQHSFVGSETPTVWWSSEQLWRWKRLVSWSHQASDAMHLALQAGAETTPRFGRLMFVGRGENVCSQVTSIDLESQETSEYVHTCCTPSPKAPTNFRLQYPFSSFLYF